MTPPRLYAVSTHHQVSVLITFINIRLPVPSLVTYNKTSYKAEDEVLHESDIGPEVTHIYQVRSTLHCGPIT